MRRAGGSTAAALTGKLLPQLLVYLFTSTVCVWWLYGYLHFPCHCGLPRMWLVTALFVAGCQGMGVFMFTMLPTLRLGLSFASLWGVISFSICGMSFPCIAMHPVLQGLAWLFPLRHFYLLYVNCALNGYGLGQQLPSLLCLLAFALLPLLCLPRLGKVLREYAYLP